jgi:hypothetical protein
MTNHTPEDLAATSRAARAVANWRAADPSWSRPVWEARQDGIDEMEKLAMAAIVLAGDLADKLHADRAQAVLDNHAINAGAYEEEQLKRDVDE